MEKRLYSSGYYLHKTKKGQVDLAQTSKTTETLIEAQADLVEQDSSEASKDSEPATAENHSPTMNAAAASIAVASQSKAPGQIEVLVPAPEIGVPLLSMPAPETITADESMLYNLPLPANGEDKKPTYWGSTVALVFGILSILYPPLGLIALLTGTIAIFRIAISKKHSGMGLAIAGIALFFVGIALWTAIFAEAGWL